MRTVLVASLALAACGRSPAVPDRDLGGLVISPKPPSDHVDLAKAARDPAELGRALMLPQHVVAGALGPCTIAITSDTSVDEAGKPVEQLSGKTTIEMGAKAAYHAVYTNSADYGREVMFTGGELYLRPRYQRWHERAPETADEPQQVRDSFYDAIGATWDLLAPGAELTDGGAVQVAGRAGHRIVVALSRSPRRPPAEPLAQRKWRAHRTVDALSGEVVLDAANGVPLHVKLAGTIGFARDGRHFTMKVSVDSDVAKIGQAVALAAPGADEVVKTPERLGEVDDRDFLLQGIAPPLRTHPPGGAGALGAPAAAPGAAPKAAPGGAPKGAR